MIIKIALAERKDFDVLMALYRAAVGEEGCTWNEAYPSEEDIRGDLDRESLYCARDEDGEIIAAFAIDHDEEVDGLSCWSPELVPAGEISRLVVRGDCRNQGIARRMLSFGMEELKRRGFRGIHFLVGRHNERALRSYAKFAFEKAGEAELYGQDWYCYEKALGGESRPSERSAEKNAEEKKGEKSMELANYFRSIVEQDRCAVVICNLQHEIIYMNPAAAERYHNRGGAKLVGQNLLDCHGGESQERIRQVVDWFAESVEHNMIYTSYNERENKDVYMVALRDGDGALIGYYEKHEYRNRESGEFYQY